MAMRVKWTEEANRTMERYFVCSADFYSKALLRQLNNDLKRAKKLLEENPYIGQKEPLAANRTFEYRRIVLSRPFKLIYFIHEETVYIANIWDTRRSVKNLIRNL